MIDFGTGFPGPIPSVVGGSNVATNRTVELVKQGKMFMVQTVFPGLAVGATKYILLDPSLFTGQFVVLYQFKYFTTQGKAIANFMVPGTYTLGAAVPIGNKNENSSNVTPLTKINEVAVTVPGASGPFTYLAGGEVQGVNLAGGGGGGDHNFPTEVKISSPRVLKIAQTGGSGFFDLELRIVFAEI